MRVSEMPKVEAIIMPSGGSWGGVREPTIFVAAPAVLNAISAATGKRIRSVPFVQTRYCFRVIWRLGAVGLPAAVRRLARLRDHGHTPGKKSIPCLKNAQLHSL